MLNDQFEAWCREAVSGIRFPPDRRKVRRELMDHLLDHRDALLEAGYDKTTAQNLAVAAMGDAAAIRADLAAIHRPFWGFFLRATRVALALVLATALVTGYQFLRTASYQTPTDWGFDIFDPAAYRGKSSYALNYLEEFDESFTDSGYTFTVTHAARFSRTLNAYSQDFLCFRVEQTHPLPWAEYADVGRYFWAEDSRGNYYYSEAAMPMYYLDDEHAYEYVKDARSLISTCGYTDPFTFTHVLYIPDYVWQDADWIDIHYDRDGRDHVLRVQPKGGQ